jgi:transposase
MTLLTRLLPHAAQLHLDAWQTDDTAPQLTWRVTSTQALVHGPRCRLPTRRVHRRDVRTVADRPWGPGRVVLPLQVRQFCGVNGRCTRGMFTARLAPRVAPWARRTPRRTPWRGHIAVALAGTAGARRRRRLGLSRPTLVRRWRRLPLPAVATPHVLGVDDWAVRNGQTYGTVWLARERPRALALRPDREAKTVALW